MLGILVILMAVAYWMTQQTQSNNQGILPAASGLNGTAHYSLINNKVLSPIMQFRKFDRNEK